MESHDELIEKVVAHGDGRLAQQIRFILELDRLKHILRQTMLLDRSRRENDAEHSWHLMMMAIVLKEHATHEVDLTRVMHMLAIHDIVEIDAGDTFIYDEAGQADQQAREQEAADRLFSLLPDDQRDKLRALWEEFEAHETDDARFARSLDRMQPFLHNVITQGASWRKHGVTADKVRKTQSVMAGEADALHDMVERLIGFAVEEGFLPTS